MSGKWRKLRAGLALQRDHAAASADGAADGAAKHADALQPVMGREAGTVAGPEAGAGLGPERSDGKPALGRSRRGALRSKQREIVARALRREGALAGNGEARLGSGEFRHRH